MSNTDSTMQVRDFHCNNCGASLSIPKNSKGIVVCPSCKTECVIEGLVKNSEIQAKENINSGISINADSRILHQRIINAMTASECMPLDVLEKAIVKKEEHICVPAYLYYCNGMASFTYEAGNRREHKTAIDLGDKTRIEKEEYTEWTQMSSSVSATATVIASGNKEYSSVIQKLYMHMDPNRLIDVEDLEYPYDVKTASYNLPQSAAFNEYVKPYMDGILEEQAVNSLNGKTYRNISMGGSNVQKDEIIRIFLGVYHITYEYNGKEYSAFISGDGQNVVYEDVSVDLNRQRLFEEKQTALASVKNKHKYFKWGMIICTVVAIFTMGISLIGTVICAVFYFKFKKEYNNTQSTCQQEIDAIKDESKRVKEAFIQKGQLLNGIYATNN